MAAFSCLKTHLRISMFPHIKTIVSGDYFIPFWVKSFCWLKLFFYLILVFAVKKMNEWMLFIHSFFSNKLGKNETFRMFRLLSKGLRDAGFERWPRVDPSSSRPSHFSWIFSVLEGVLCLQMGWPPVFRNDTCFMDGKLNIFAHKMWMMTVW